MMKRRLTILALTTLAVVALIGVVLMAPSPAHAGGATQISGIGYSADTNAGECTNSPTEPAGTIDVVPPLKMTGSLEGCLFSFILSNETSPSGTYREWGIDIFVSNDEVSRFETTYLFTAKFDEDGNEIWGRCEHPITAGTGTGVFEGVTGRFNIKDHVEGKVLIDFPYKGHLRY
jgi:hypothetical protein